ncbi:MAG: DUF4365 domain-containing protein [Scytonema sp. PMC 1069.18]|nr:DUF4365 domain-containing protein [Scytonema sp. PMC 1069.18]MEC4884298.1 DUF4365 domain-containing protein [Scytonema sp. PMC 1070.18]
MTTQQTWYITQRAESLAIMYLTRRDDLIVSKQQPNYGLDFLVTIKKADEYSGRLFGIEVKAISSTPKSSQNGDIVMINYSLNSIDSLRELPFPVCLLFFILDKDQGYYKWILQPVIEEKKNVKLNFDKNPTFKKLTDEEINSIISDVNDWYDNRN